MWRHLYSQPSLSILFIALCFVELSDLSDCNEGIRLYSERADIFEGKLSCFEVEKMELQDFPRVWLFSDTHFEEELKLIEELKTTKKKSHLLILITWQRKPVIEIIIYYYII